MVRSQVLPKREVKAESPPEPPPARIVVVVPQYTRRLDLIIGLCTAILIAEVARYFLGGVL
jgi:hypothetical protein